MSCVVARLCDVQGLLQALEAMTALESLDVSSYSPQNLLSHHELAFITGIQVLLHGGDIPEFIWKAWYVHC